MTRRSFVQLNGKLYERGVDEIPEQERKSATVFGDLPDFISPIDGSVVSGRAGMREHCRKHGVIPTADLAGMPVKPANQPYQPDSAGIRDALRRAVYK